MKTNKTMIKLAAILTLGVMTSSALAGGTVWIVVPPHADVIGTDIRNITYPGLNLSAPACEYKGKPGRVCGVTLRNDTINLEDNQQAHITLRDANGSGYCTFSIRSKTQTNDVLFNAEPVCGGSWGLMHPGSRPSMLSSGTAHYTGIQHR